MTASDNAPLVHDVVVVGGGAAGLSAALVLGRARRRVAVVDAGAPRNAPAAHMQGFLSRDGMPPADAVPLPGQAGLERGTVSTHDDVSSGPVRRAESVCPSVPWTGG